MKFEKSLAKTKMMLTFATTNVKSEIRNLKIINH